MSEIIPNARDVMKIVSKIEDVRESVREARKRGKRIGFVPTNGFPP
jgi:pantothenate synthetase